MAHVTEMYRVINFVLEMKTLGLRMVPIFKDGIWKLEALSDSDFANDKDTRYSVYGYIIYFCADPVAWKSKSMKSVVLSQLKQNMWQFQKWSRRSSFCTKCYGAWRERYHYLSKFKWTMLVQDQVIEINFVKSAETDSDIMTKNQQGQHYMYAKSKLVYTVQDMNEKKAIEDIEDEETGRMLES